ncbi:MAG: hypothetical protein FWD56_06065 [Bacteroidales bacterium]|nr:hypothetical protein [Bacteroidales bacterium]
MKSHLKDFEVFTIVEMGWCGVKNGKLLSLCVAHSFDIFLTIDKNMLFQQNFEKFPISVVILNSTTSKIEELLHFVPSFLKQVYQFEKNKAYIVEKST